MSNGFLVWPNLSIEYRLRLGTAGSRHRFRHLLPLLRLLLAQDMFSLVNHFGCSFMCAGVQQGLIVSSTHVC